jgi:hypothetical protein
MDAQEEHDYRMSKRRLLENNKPKLEALLQEKTASSKAKSQPELLDPIEAAIKNNPGLTRQKAAEMAEKFGF